MPEVIGKQNEANVSTVLLKGIIMKIDILCVGKIKEKFYRDALDEYKKRLSRYATMSVIEVADEKTPDNASETVEDQIKEKVQIEI
jgi:23S rRNA pseudoU1915 N3-methylase RlmH